jgi:ATP-dependent Clp protease, protease subunit
MNTIILNDDSSEESSFDVYSKLANDRILFINGTIDDTLASNICATLLLKDSESNKKITLFINSNGGDIRNCFMILDVMNYIHSSIETICMGAADYGAALLLAGGTSGMRFCTQNSIITFGQLTHEYAYYTNVVDAKEILKRCLDDNNKMMSAIAKFSNTSLKSIQEKFKVKLFMKSSEALKNGFIDKIIKSKKN